MLDKSKILCEDRLDFLPGTEYYLWQSKDVLCFTMDSIILASFATLRRAANVLELGAGTGAISLKLLAKGAKSVVAMELNPALVEKLNKTLEYNRLHDRLTILPYDLKNHRQTKMDEKFDLVVANPPYRVVGTGEPRKFTNAEFACQEVSASVEDFIVSAKYFTKYRGRVALVNVPERLTEIISLLEKNQFQAKRLQFVHSFADKPAKLFLIEAIKGAAPSGLEVLEPIIAYNQDNEFTKQLLKFYE